MTSAIRMTADSATSILEVRVFFSQDNLSLDALTNLITFARNAVIKENGSRGDVVANFKNRVIFTLTKCVSGSFSFEKKFNEEFDKSWQDVTRRYQAVTDSVIRDVAVEILKCSSQSYEERCRGMGSKDEAKNKRNYSAGGIAIAGAAAATGVGLFFVATAGATAAYFGYSSSKSGKNIRERWKSRQRSQLFVVMLFPNNRWSSPKFLIRKIDWRLSLAYAVL